MSPEQARGLAVDGRADLYSLGVMLYEMLVGKPPFSASDSISLAIKHCQEPVPRLPEHLHKYQQLVDRLLAKEMKNRFQNGVEVMVAIDNLLKAGNGRPAPLITGSDATPVPLSVDDGKLPNGKLPSVSVYDRPSTFAVEPTKSKGYQAFFRTSETIGGNFFFKKYSRVVEFSCDDYEEFKEKREQMHDVLMDWLNERGKKAIELHVNIQAHPWIHGRIWDALTDEQPFDSPFGMLLDQATVSLHLHDELEPESGRKLLLRDKGKKPVQQSA
jgi:serine/threonine protein kinase